MGQKYSEKPGSSGAELGAGGRWAGSQAAGSFGSSAQSVQPSQLYKRLTLEANTSAYSRRAPSMTRYSSGRELRRAP